MDLLPPRDLDKDILKALSLPLVERAVDVVYLAFRKALNAVSHNILTGRLMKPGWLDGW